MSALFAWRLPAAVAMLFAGLLAAARADDDHRPRPAPALPKYTQECGSCHVAYPPGLLPAASWRRMMSGLNRHYGTDASLDAANTAELGAWLAANAGTHRRVREAPPDDRITRSAWFTRKHDEVAPAVWKSPAVQSPANCTACHPQAARGDFDEHAVRIPR